MGSKALRVAIAPSLRQEILWSGLCAYCGYDIPTQVDHVIPVSRGGTNDRANLVPACKDCNMNKLDFTPDEWKAYRLEEGLCWPPESPRDFIARTYFELKAKYVAEHGCEPDLADAIRRSMPKRDHQE